MASAHLHSYIRQNHNHPRQIFIMYLHNQYITIKNPDDIVDEDTASDHMAGLLRSTVTLQIELCAARKVHI